MQLVPTIEYKNIKDFDQNEYDHFIQLIKVEVAREHEVTRSTLINRLSAYYGHMEGLEYELFKEECIKELDELVKHNEILRSKGQKLWTAPIRLVSLGHLSSNQLLYKILGGPGRLPIYIKQANLPELPEGFTAINNLDWAGIHTPHLPHWHSVKDVVLQEAPNPPVNYMDSEWHQYNPSHKGPQSYRWEDLSNINQDLSSQRRDQVTIWKRIEDYGEQYYLGYASPSQGPNIRISQAQATVHMFQFDRLSNNPISISYDKENSELKIEGFIPKTVFKLLSLYCCKHSKTTKGVTHYQLHPKLTDTDAAFDFELVLNEIKAYLLIN